MLYVQGLAGPEMVAVGIGRLLRKPVALKIVGDNAWEYAIRKGLTADGIDAFQHATYGPQPAGRSGPRSRVRPPGQPADRA